MKIKPLETLEFEMLDYTADCKLQLFRYEDELQELGILRLVNSLGNPNAIRVQEITINPALIAPLKNVLENSPDYLPVPEHHQDANLDFAKNGIDLALYPELLDELRIVDKLIKQTKADKIIWKRTSPWSFYYENSGVSFEFGESSLAISTFDSHKLIRDSLAHPLEQAIFEQMRRCKTEIEDEKENLLERAFKAL